MGRGFPSVSFLGNCALWVGRRWRGTWERAVDGLGIGNWPRVEQRPVNSTWRLQSTWCEWEERRNHSLPARQLLTPVNPILGVGAVGSNFYSPLGGSDFAPLVGNLGWGWGLVVWGRSYPTCRWRIGPVGNKYLKFLWKFQSLLFLFSFSPFPDSEGLLFFTPWPKWSFATFCFPSGLLLLWIHVGAICHLSKVTVKLSYIES